jgi:WD40 repeat protein
VEFPPSCADLVFSASGRLAACPGTDGTATIWEVDTGQKIAQFRGHVGAVSHVQFSPDERRLISAGVDRTARLWDLERSSDALLLGGYEAKVEHAAWSSDGLLAATGSFDGMVRVWDTRAGGLVSESNAGARVRSLGFADDKRLLVGSYAERGVRVLDARTGVSLADLNMDHTRVAGAVEFTRDGSVVFAAVEEAAGAGGGTANTLARLLSTPLSGQSKGVGWSLPRRKLARWDAASGRPLEALEADRGVSLPFADFLSFSVAAGLACLPTDADDTSRVWDIQSGRLVAEIKLTCGVSSIPR